MRLKNKWKRAKATSSLSNSFSKMRQQMGFPLFLIISLFFPPVIYFRVSAEASSTIFPLYLDFSLYNRKSPHLCMSIVHTLAQHTQMLPPSLSHSLSTTFIIRRMHLNMNMATETRFYSLCTRFFFVRFLGPSVWGEWKMKWKKAPSSCLPKTFFFFIGVCFICLSSAFLLLLFLHLGFSWK